MSKIEKIKREVLEELAKMERKELEEAGKKINLEDILEKVIEKIYKRAVDLAISKTAKAIFEEIEKEFGEEWSGYGNLIVVLDEDLENLKQKWLGDEE